MNKIWDLERYKENTAVIDEHGFHMTYGKLYEDSGILASKVGKRCLVFSFCRNEIGSVLGYIAFLNNGIVPVMVSSNLDKALLNDLLTKYQPEYLWLPSDMTDEFKGMTFLHEAYGYKLLKTDYAVTYPLYD